ncbi:MAG: MFS transporter [Clostridia bacterium]|nr:MFS transporter [Clostridia bacterium]
MRKINIDGVKDAVGIEGSVKEFIKPMAAYTCANITLGGAGYPIGMYHQQFLSFVEGLDTHITGTLSMINGVIDAVSDVVMGLITDRTRSKYGKHRLYVLIGAFPFVISYIMKWCSFGISGRGNVGLTFAYYLIAALLYSTSYTMMSVPHVAMLPTIEPRYFRRTQYKIVEYAMNSVGQVSSFIFMGLMLGGFNMPDPSPADRGKYLFCGIVLAAWFFWSPVLSFFTCPEPSSLSLHTEPVDWKYLFHEYYLVFKNRAFRQYFLISMFNSFRASFYSYSDQYFIISIANKYRHFNTLNVVAGVSEFMGSPANYFLNRYFGKRISGTLFTPIMVSGLLLYAFVKENTPSAVLFLATVLYNFGFSGPGFALETIQPDITDVDEMITGRRREGVIATFRSFVAKTINSFMTGILGFSLKFFGYDVTKKEPQFQSPKTIFGLRLIFTYMPMLFGILTWILVNRFSMTKKDHEEMQRVIKERRETGHCEITEEQKKRLEIIAGQKWEDMWIGSPVLVETD